MRRSLISADLIDLIIRPLKMTDIILFKIALVGSAQQLIGIRFFLAIGNPNGINVLHKHSLKLSKSLYLEVPIHGHVLMPIHLGTPQ